MAGTNTPNIGLTKPATTDVYDLSVWNGNSDIIDDQIGNLSNSINALSQNALSYYGELMGNGYAVTIDCHGDSTYWGYLNGGTQATTPAPLQLQNILRSFYADSQITVINSGLSGNQTTNALRTWSSDMASSTGQIVYMNYGINDMEGGNPTGVSDPAINAEQFRENLRQMVTIARQKGKLVILETPNPVTYDSGDSLGPGIWKVEGVKQFADATRQVAKELNVPLVDSFSHYQKYINGLNNIMNAFQPGGVHPTQAGYIFKGTNMALPFVSPGMPVINGEMIIPAGGSTTQASYPAPVSSPGSRSGYCMISNSSVRIAFYVDVPGLDIYIATPIWGSGSNSASVKVDGTQVFTVNLNDGTFTNNLAAVDQEILVMQNASPGLHVIELVGGNTSTTQVGFYYVRSRQTRTRWTVGDGTISKRLNVINDLDVTLNNANDYNHLLLDIPTSRTLNTVDIAFNAQLSKNAGIFLFGFPVGPNTGNPPHGGLYMYLNGSGYLCVNEGNGQSGYATETPIVSSDQSTAVHTFRITVTPAGLVTIYVDGVQQGTYTMTTHRYGGFLGLWTSHLTSMHINWLDLYS